MAGFLNLRRHDPGGGGTEGAVIRRKKAWRDRKEGGSDASCGRPRAQVSPVGPHRAAGQGGHGAMVLAKVACQVTLDDYLRSPAAAPWWKLEE